MQSDKSTTYHGFVSVNGLSTPFQHYIVYSSVSCDVIVDRRTLLRGSGAGILGGQRRETGSVQDSGDSVGQCGILWDSVGHPATVREQEKIVARHILLELVCAGQCYRRQ